jgi:hypothetical protein
MLMLGSVVALALVLLELLGTPAESARAGGQLCWDYGTPLSKGGTPSVSGGAR